MYLYGRNVLQEILDSGNFENIKRIMISDNAKGNISKLKNAMDFKGLKYSIAPVKVIEKLIGQNVPHQGILIDFKEFEYSSLEEIINKSEGDDYSHLIILDQVQDPHNFGAIIRSAYGSDASGIIILKNNCAEVTPAVIKVSTGLAFKIPIAQESNMINVLNKLKNNGYWIYGADMGGTPYPEVNFSKKTGLVLGNEGSGIRKLVRENCDEIISIPMKKGTDSLNVSVSAGILCFSIYEKRLYPKEAR